MKKCSACQALMEPTKFYKNASRKDGLNQSCKPCHNAEVTKRNKKTLKVRRTLIAELKDVPCACCGVQYPAYAMEFHHIDPSSKYKDVSQLMAHAMSTLLAEIAKCVIVCANCHAGITQGILSIPLEDE